jgi:centriolar protein POC1
VSTPQKTPPRVRTKAPAPAAAASPLPQPASPLPQPPAAPEHPSAPPMPDAPPVTAIDDAVTSTLGHIVGQLDVLTQTMQLLEERLSMNEDKVNRMVNIIGAAAARSTAAAEEQEAQAAK